MIQVQFLKHSHDFPEARGADIGLQNVRADFDKAEHLV